MLWLIPRTRRDQDLTTPEAPCRHPKPRRHKPGPVCDCTTKLFKKSSALLVVAMPAEAWIGLYCPTSEKAFRDTVSSNAQKRSFAPLSGCVELLLLLRGDEG